ncbi:hypothetical protein [Actinosynnema sp. NPDC020468]
MFSALKKMLDRPPPGLRRWSPARRVSVIGCVCSSATRLGTFGGLFG